MSRTRAARQGIDASVSARERRLVRRRSRSAHPDGGPLFKPSPRALASRPELDDIPAPNLLGPDSTLTLAADVIIGALDFAFAGGSCAELLPQALEAAPLPASDFEPECFAEDLFVADLVETAMGIDIAGWRPALQVDFITRVLCRPPRDVTVIAYRREILRELADEPTLRRAFEQLYRSLVELWRLLGEAASTSRYEATRRRIDALALVRRVVEISCGSFAQASSGLARIGTYAEAVMASDGFARLAEVLDYENDMAKIDVRMHVGVDGRVRDFRILEHSENDDNRFYATPLSRWIGKLVMLWRGYRFSEDELVDRWLDQVFEGVVGFLPSFLMLTGHLEVHLASLALRDRCEAKGLATCFPELSESGEREAVGLFNPLLFSQDVVPTPCTLSSRARANIAILTGPNSGGKTRLLQALGLAQLLAQGGFFAPMAAGVVPLASGMFVSVIAEHAAGDKEGRLGTELIRIRRLFEKARGGALVILDELCSGTNPSEGEEIFHLVLRLLAELGPQAFISTHFLTFARRLMTEPAELPLAFLQVQLDEHQRPTYGFTEGVATTSLAARTAARLGVTREELMTLVLRNKRP